MYEWDYKYISALVIRSQHHDSDAFAELYAMTYDKVYNYAYHYIKDSYLAQDAVQEIYILALKNILKINDPSLFVAWLNQISFRVCFDICRKSKDNYNLIDSEILEIIYDEHIDSNPEESIQRDAEIQRLKDAIEKLPYNEKQVITLRYYNNMKIDEIVNVASISRSSVKRYLASGQRSLQQTLKE